VLDHIPDGSDVIAGVGNGEPRASSTKTAAGVVALATPSLSSSQYTFRFMLPSRQSFPRPCSADRFRAA
jgi:hypothetical protein